MKQPLLRRPSLDPEKYQRIIYDPGLVTRIILNRPRYLNALSHAHLAELEDAFERAAADEDCNVVVLSGNGSSFCAGDDTFGLTPESAPHLADGVKSLEEQIVQYGSETAVWGQYNLEHSYYIGWPFLHKIRYMPKPTISMVHGYSIYMGYLLPMACDMVFASEDALFLAAPGHYVNPIQLWTMGPRKLMEILFENRFMPANEAHELTLVNRVFSDRETLERETMAFAYRLADESPDSLRASKLAILDMEDALGYATTQMHATNQLRPRGRSSFVRPGRASRGTGLLGFNRYEGKAMARTPVSLAALKAKLDSEGQPVPEHVQAAIEKARARNDKDTWQRVLHAESQDSTRATRADAGAANYALFLEEQRQRKKEEVERRGLDIPDVEKVGAERIT